jgi:hypothetical protein
MSSTGRDESLTVHVDRPQDGEAVVITGEAVLLAIEAGKLSWQEAMQRKLLGVVPSATGRPGVPTFCSGEFVKRSNSARMEGYGGLAQSAELTTRQDCAWARRRGLQKWCREDWQRPMGTQTSSMG